MHFCEVCSNMLYISIIPETNKLIYYCKNCGNKDETITETNLSVIKTELKKSEKEFSHIINKYTKYDPTLPRINTILCPNTSCNTNAKEDNKTEREILYIRYDDVNMKYVYMCCSCDTYWKSEENK